MISTETSSNGKGAAAIAEALRATNFRLLRKAGEAASPDCPGIRPGSHATSICPAPDAPILFTAPGAFHSKGKRRVKVVPSSAVLVTAMAPLWAWAMSRAMASLNP